MRVSYIGDKELEKTITSSKGFLNKITISDVVSLLFALRAISFVWLAFASSGEMTLLVDIVFLVRYSTVAIGPLYVLIKSRMIKKEQYLYLFPVLLFLMMHIFNTYGGYHGTYLQEAISIGSFLLFDRNDKIKVFHYFYSIVFVCSIVSIVLYILYIINVPIFKLTPYYNNGVQTSYYHSWFIFAIEGDRKYTLPRLCGIFNEPGGLGTVSGLLFASKYNELSKKEKIIWIFTVLFTFSVAGYILIMMSYALHSWKKGPKYILIFIGIIIFFLLIPHIDWRNDFLNRYAQRFAITSNGLAGNDRTNAVFNSIYDEFLHSNKVFFGMGANYSQGTGASSYKALILQFGFWGFGLYFVFWFISALNASRNNRECIVLIIVFLFSFLQRPMTITNSYGYMLLFGGMEWILEKDGDSAKERITSVNEQSS